ncbi:hypothetical protein CGC20_38230 [Leishmania donovani]|uniref:Uncharacterized protein n=1 Tax=Leishmania donovani TaxID=5661 RepID=A0A504Y7C5_LEIDO|nr:hypothetical protein CGC20_38230 [Leishmania donovani]
MLEYQRQGHAASACASKLCARRSRFVSLNGSSAVSPVVEPSRLLLTATGLFLYSHVPTPFGTIGYTFSNRIEPVVHAMLAPRFPLPVKMPQTMLPEPRSQTCNNGSTIATQARQENASYTMSSRVLAIGNDKVEDAGNDRYDGGDNDTESVAVLGEDAQEGCYARNTSKDADDRRNGAVEDACEVRAPFGHQPASVV